MLIAYRLYFGDHNVNGMLAKLLPLHEMMEVGPQTHREVTFMQTFGRDLMQAYEWIKRYQSTKQENDLQVAWEKYYSVFRRISKLLPQFTTLELQYVSPALLEANDMVYLFL